MQQMMFLGLFSCPHPQPVPHTSPLTFLNLSWEPFSLGVVDFFRKKLGRVRITAIPSAFTPSH